MVTNNIGNVKHLIVLSKLAHSVGHWHHFPTHLVMFGVESNCTIKIQNWVILVEFCFTKPSLVKAFCKIRIYFHSLCKIFKCLEELEHSPNSDTISVNDSILLVLEKLHYFINFKTCLTITLIVFRKKSCLFFITKGLLFLFTD